MDPYTTEEMKYKNGYDAGYQDGYEKGKQDAVTHAKWVYVGVSSGKKVFTCTRCRSLFTATGNYCYECGSRMDGGANE